MKEGRDWRQEAKCVVCRDGVGWGVGVCVFFLKGKSRLQGRNEIGGTIECVLLAIVEKHNFRGFKFIWKLFTLDKFTSFCEVP